MVKKNDFNMFPCESKDRSSVKGGISGELFCGVHLLIIRADVAALVEAGPLSRDFGTHKAVKTRFWFWLLRKSP